MVNEKDLALMDKIMNVFAQKGEWQEIQMNDPRITAAYTRFDAALERIEAEDLHEELYDAYMAGVSAAGDAGILFGIHVAEIIRDVAARPADLSRYVLKRMEARG